MWVPLIQWKIVKSERVSRRVLFNEGGEKAIRQRLVLSFHEHNWNAVSGGSLNAQDEMSFVGGVDFVQNWKLVLKFQNAWTLQMSSCLREKLIWRRRLEDYMLCEVEFS